MEGSDSLFSTFSFSFSSTPEQKKQDQEQKKQKPSPPPCMEIQLSEASNCNNNSEAVMINDSLTLFKGRASTFDVFGVPNSDLLPGKYEGGLKLWEASLDLLRILHSHITQPQPQPQPHATPSVKGMRVLEIGCGHGLPGILAALQGASLVHFQDFNAEVLRCLTIPNVQQNISRDLPELCFFTGDWSEVHNLLLCASPENQNEDAGASCAGYDLILMAETVYDISSLNCLYHLIKKCLKRNGGVVYMAGKKYYFGVGGGTRQFIRLVEEDGMMEACMISEVADGASNVREVWKFELQITTVIFYQNFGLHSLLLHSSPKVAVSEGSRNFHFDHFEGSLKEFVVHVLIDTFTVYFLFSSSWFILLDSGMSDWLCNSSSDHNGNRKHKVLQWLLLMGKWHEFHVNCCKSIHQ